MVDETVNVNSTKNKRVIVGTPLYRLVNKVAFGIVAGIAGIHGIAWYFSTHTNLPEKYPQYFSGGLEYITEKAGLYGLTRASNLENDGNRWAVLVDDIKHTIGAEILSKIYERFTGKQLFPRIADPEKALKELTEGQSSLKEVIKSSPGLTDRLIASVMPDDPPQPENTTKPAPSSNASPTPSSS